MTMMMKPKFDEAAVSQEAINDFDAADKHLRQGYKHFLHGFCRAAEDVAQEYGGFEKLPSPKDQKAVFKIVQAVARQHMKLSANTFDRYCKIARYCIIYHVCWEIASQANRAALRWCQKRIKEESFKKNDAFKKKAFATCSKQEKMEVAWGEWVKDLTLNANDNEEDPKPKPELLHLPLPKDGEDEDGYWTGYLAAQVSHIKKHMDLLSDGDKSKVKTVVLNFYGAASQIVESAKAK